MYHLKTAGYIVAALAIISLLFLSIERILLASPTNGLLLALISFAFAGVLYALTAGPVWIMQHQQKAREYFRQRVFAASLSVSLGVAICGFLPIVPTVASMVSGSFAGACLLLRAVAGESKGRTHAPRPMIV